MLPQHPVGIVLENIIINYILLMIFNLIFFILFHYYNRCYCYFRMLYWFFDGNEPKLLFFCNIRPSDNNICHIIIGSTTSEPIQQNFIGLTSGQQKVI